MDYNYSPSSWKLPSVFEQYLSEPLPNVIDKLLPPATKPPPLAITSSVSITNPFLKALNSIPDARTTNGALAYSTTDSALVDLFYCFTPGVSADAIFECLTKAWQEDSSVTLKIILQTRSIHEGKAFKEGFFRAASWLWEYHPRTLLANLHLLVDPTCERQRSKNRDKKAAEEELASDDGVVTLDDEGEIECTPKPEYPFRPHGCFDDLIDLLVLALNGQLTTSYKGQLTAIDESLAPAHMGRYFRNFRLENKRCADRVGPSKTESNRIVSSIRRKAFHTIHVTVTPKSPSQPLTEKNKTVDDKDEDEVSTLAVNALSVNDPSSDNIKRKAEENEDNLQRKLAKCSSKQSRAAVLNDRLHIALSTNKKLQALYLAVVDLFVSFLRVDLDLLDAHLLFCALPPNKRKEAGYPVSESNSSPYLFGMSYAAKWAPTPAHGADKQLHLATALALKLFPQQTTKNARMLLQKKVLTPLRSVLHVPEVDMVGGQWSISYPHVPARAMARYQRHFIAHDEQGFNEYLDLVALNKTTISAGSMLPHELLMATFSKSPTEARVAELQWKSLVDSISSSAKSSKLSNCIAVADVSNSMGSLSFCSFKTRTASFNRKYTHEQPIWPCIAMTLLMAELSEAPWNSSFITFSTDPKIERVDSNASLADRARSLNRAHWEMSTNFLGVFEAILQAAKTAKLKPKDMVKKIFVFSDMQFNQGGTFGETEHDAVVRLFGESNYPVPELVYWNLAASASQPVKAVTPGVALVSGFSANLLKYFLKSFSQQSTDDLDEDSDWLKIDVDECDNVAQDGKARKETGKNPLEHVLTILSAESFRGVTIVD